MSLKRNISINYISQAYVTIAGILVVPMYLKNMGAEVYGLVGFFSMLQAWFQLLDLGISSTFAREVSRYRAGGCTAFELRSLEKSLGGIFITLAIIIAILVWLCSGWISHDWFKTNNIQISVLTNAVIMMGIAAALRLISGFFRGAILGYEAMAWLGVFNIAIASLRFPGALLIIIFISSNPLAFFGYQLFVSAIEAVILIYKSNKVLPRTPNKVLFSFEPLMQTWKFSLSIAFTSSVWVMVTQTDKLVLSKMLTLSEYGYFTIATMIAGGINMLVAPISQALIPRFSYLAAQPDTDEVYTLYRESSQLISILVWPVASVLAFFGSAVIFSWTGNHDVSTFAAPILFWYALGTALIPIIALPFFLQFAFGNLRLHVYGNVIFVSVLIPLLIIFTLKFGAIGAAWVWFGSNVAFFLSWTPIVHRYFLPNMHVKWLIKDIIPIACSTIVVGYCLKSFILMPTERFQIFVILLAVGCGILLVAIASSSVARKKFLKIALAGR